MTERKQLKKQLSKLKYYQRSLPRLIDCSNAYGDNYYNESDTDSIDKQIKEVEYRILEIDSKISR